MLALSIGLISCTAEVPGTREYTLTISSTEGGSVTSPGELGSYTYDEGKAVNLVAKAEAGYGFANWAGDVSAIADPNAAATTITMNDNYSIVANFYEIPMIYYFDEGVVTFPDSSVGTTIRGDIGERGYLFPSDVQDHNPFH
jgi:hypothetical protein